MLKVSLVRREAAKCFRKHMGHFSVQDIFGKGIPSETFFRKFACDLGFAGSVYNDCTSECTRECISGYVSEYTKHVNEYTSEYSSEYVSEYISA